jgi:large repetitive protein
VHRILLFCLLGFVPFTLRAVTVTATATPTACTPCNGSITATGASGTAPYQYSIDGGVTWQSSGTFPGLCAATYTITVRDAVLATANTTAMVVQNPPLTWSASGVNCTAINLCNGQINVTISGGIPPYTIRLQWSANTQYFSSSPITNLCPGTYSVTVIDATNNCGLGYTGPVVITIGVGPPHGPGNLYCTTGYTVGNCNQICDNTFTASGVGGTPPYMYSLNGGPYQSSGIFTNQCEGNNTYTICVRDAAMNIWCVQAYYPTNPTYMRWPPTVTASGCPCSGSIVFSPAGNPGEQFWLIQNNVTIATNSTGSFTGLCPGNYTVSSMYNGCGLTYPVQIVPGNPTYSVTITTTNPTCYNNCNGSLTCTPSPWSPTGYQYSKDNGVTWQTSNTFTNLCPATYNILVRDSVNCYGSYNPTIANPAQLPLSLAVSHPNCANGNCLGGIICTPTSGPTGPYEWSRDGGVTWQTSNQFLNLCAGTYTITVRDANGCTRTNTAFLSTTLFQYYLADLHGNPTCSNPCGGYINLTLGSSNAPVAYNEYTIDSGATWQTGLGFSNLCAGTYYARAHNTLTGCYSPWRIITLTAPAPQVVSAASPQPSCPSSCNGTIQATFVSGTNPPYQYSIDGGVTWQSSTLFTGVCAGTYTVTIKNSINCTGTQTVVVNSTPVVTATATTADPVCMGDCNGTVTVSASSTPAQTFQYSIDGGVSWFASNAFSGLCAGNVNVQVRDSFNCITTTGVALSNPPPMITSVAAQPPLCSDVCNGTILFNPAQPAGYTYSIDSGLTWQSTTSYSGLCAGPYTVIIEDSVGCSYDSSFTFIAPPPITSSTTVTSISCNNLCDGSVALNASPAGTYMYSLDSGLTWQAGNLFTNLCSGMYDYQIEDTNGCTANGNVVIVNPSPVTFTVSGNMPSCYGGGDGMLFVNTNLNAPNVSIDGGSTWSNDTTFYPLSAGTYIVHVTDSVGCLAIDTAYLFNPPQLYLLTNEVADTCGACVGSVLFSHNVPPWEQFIINVSPVNAQTNLCAGNYAAVITNANGCTALTTFTIQNIGFSIDSVSTTPATVNQSNGCASVFVSGNSGPYTYQWDSAAAFQMTDTACGLATGNYCCVVTDANGCTDSICVTVGVITTLEETIAMKLDIFPNPANTSFTIMGANTTLNVALYDLQGRMIVDYGGRLFYAGGTTFEIPGAVASGNYVVEMVYGDLVVRKKLVVER